MRHWFFAVDVRRHACCVGIGAAVAMSCLDVRLPAAEEPDPRVVASLQRFLAHPTRSHQYSASRRLEASGSGQRGWMEVQTDFTIAAGLSYEVTAEGGSGYIRTRVLRSLLDEEQRVVAQGGARVSTANYQFTPERLDEQGLAVVRLQPLRKDRSLITGRMFLTLDQGDLVRLEGRLAKNPSFWVSRVEVVRSFRRINGVLMPVSLETTAQLRLLGSSRLHMIDDQPVNEEHV
jgi:hypothetical protein